MFRGSVAMQTGEVMWARGELLGEGAYGKVFAGLNQLTGELMAVKQLKARLRLAPRSLRPFASRGAAQACRMRARTRRPFVCVPSRHIMPPLLCTA